MFRIGDTVEVNSYSVGVEAIGKIGVIISILQEEDIDEDDYGNEFEISYQLYRVHLDSPIRTSWGDLEDDLYFRVDELTLSQRIPPKPTGFAQFISKIEDPEYVPNV